MTLFAVSSWSLDGSLQAGLPLLELPQQLKNHGIPYLELCHFHLPSTSPEYLQDFKQALQNANITLYSLLIDMGDIASPDEAQRTKDLREIKNWIDIASTLGAEQVRIVAGNQASTPEVIERSCAHLNELAQYAKQKGLHTSTENWQKTSEDTDGLLEIIEKTSIRLIADIGNAEGPQKYDTLSKLLPKANSIHFKTRKLSDQNLDTEDLNKVLQMIQESQFSGVITLIYDKKQNEWEEIITLRDLIAS